MLFSLDGTDPATPFPPATMAETDPEGLLAIGGDLSETRLLNAYRAGIFPWFSENQPLLWWSPDPRTLLFPDRLHVSRSLRKTLRRKVFDVTFDTAF
ncbi:MAG: leucyl/phenylalanyl-tRNA--protein transferase, partial [Sedimenticolaceae bacterium]|nr:leucyl/phenylalanyl-tRNA--protein transferase [Sedimenticolaceae bacterium]